MAAAILFELNSDPAQVDALGASAGLAPAPPPPGTPDSPDAAAARERFRLEWWGFVHAAVTAGLMQHAPNVVMAEYVRGTRGLLERLGLPADACDSFVDAHYTPYMKLLATERARECPALMLRRLRAGGEVTDGPATRSAPGDAHALAVMAGAMAMLVAAIHDKLEAYDIQAHPA